MRKALATFWGECRSNAFCLAVCGPLLATGNCQLALGPPPTHEQTCLDFYRTWEVIGLTPEQVPDTPDQLLKAHLRVGDTVLLQVTTQGSSGSCNDVVKSVSWGSTVPMVAAVTASGSTTGQLDALSPGETAAWADVLMNDGTNRRAELYAIPAGRSQQLRVYAVEVTR